MWIQKALANSKPGVLRRAMHTKMGHNIPAKKLNAAIKKGGITGKRASLAKTLKGFHHKQPEQDEDIGNTIYDYDVSHSAIDTAMDANALSSCAVSVVDKPRSLQSNTRRQTFGQDRAC